MKANVSCCSSEYSNFAFASSSLLMLLLKLLLQFVHHSDSHPALPHSLFEFFVCSAKVCPTFSPQTNRPQRLLKSLVANFQPFLQPQLRPFALELEVWQRCLPKFWDQFFRDLHQLLYLCWTSSPAVTFSSLLILFIIRHIWAWNYF